MTYKSLFTTLCLLVLGINTMLGARTPAATIPNGTLQLTVLKEPKADRFANLGYGIRISFLDDTNGSNLVHLYDASATQKPQMSPNPVPKQFFPNAFRQYMRTMGMNVDADPATDYIMEITLEEFHCDYLSGIGWNGVVMMNLKVLDHTQKVVYPSVEIMGTSSTQGSAYSLGLANLVLNQAITNAFEDIDWDRIAFYLNKPIEEKKNVIAAKEQVEAEKAKKDLTKRIIYWSINSRPEGADVYWRVVSSSDEVNNQNSKYLDTTPYEANQALNIKGLTEENASDVQIVIRVEKDGYMPQTKKFNVQAIEDDREIVAFFKLVKEDSEE